ncbi:MAG TPA: hypothetical protein VH951_01500, partial [Dehalococcoidia bacterium]
FAGTMMIFGTAIATRRFNLFPGWFFWLSIVCGIALFFAAAFFPLIALGIWMIAASIVLMRHQPAAAATAAA